MKVDWKPIEQARINGTVYWLSGFKYKGKRRLRTRWVERGYFSKSERSWVNSELDDEHLEPTHYADDFIPDPPK